MSVRPCTITVKGYSFDIGQYSEEQVEEWRSAGLEVDQVYGSSPSWVPWTLMVTWFVLVDLFHLRWRNALDWLKKEEK